MNAAQVWKKRESIRHDYYHDHHHHKTSNAHFTDSQLKKISAETEMTSTTIRIKASQSHTEAQSTNRAMLHNVEGRNLCSMRLFALNLEDLRQCGIFLISLWVVCLRASWCCRDVYPMSSSALNGDDHLGFCIQRWLCLFSILIRSFSNNSLI